jgi:hypothetical protein
MGCARARVLVLVVREGLRPLPDPARTRRLVPTRSRESRVPGWAGRRAPRGHGNPRSGETPHVRGPPEGAVAHGCDEGTTPAPAGSTGQGGVRAHSAGDHPRTRGEHSDAAGAMSPDSGPPPHPRGAPPAEPAGVLVKGTTPAPAGSTGLGGQCRGRPPDHPRTRTRGEHVPPPEVCSLGPGPPPHPRGAHFLTCCFTGEVRRFPSPGSPRSRTPGHRPTVPAHPPSKPGARRRCCVGRAGQGWTTVHASAPVVTRTHALASVPFREAVIGV